VWVPLAREPKSFTAETSGCLLNTPAINAVSLLESDVIGSPPAQGTHAGMPSQEDSGPLCLFSNGHPNSWEHYNAELHFLRTQMFFIMSGS